MYYKPIELVSSKITPHFCRPEIRKVKRVLFEPVDHIATQRFVEEELEKVRVTKSEKWNFDFQHERSLSPSGDYQWKPATPVKKQPLSLKHAIIEFEGQDLYPVPGDIIRPIPIMLSSTPRKEVTSPRKTHPRTQPQRLITGE
ncbi:uncharacterized protein LOC114342300 [Diabrotica virgifera virgifera]|uniref:Uncharacterized protein LOC114342300 n=1 Tax=Diabrotica virgifera virgifera TaxID=50390 RepID=A0A6P7GYP8_DIAVI|nr:uncharacterized protein LOC114342300 [Diabrotica virgifera virgifera]